MHKHGLRSQLHNHLKDWLRLPLDEISKSMVVERHRVMAKVPSAANHVFRQFRTIWNHARRTHDLAESPTMAIEWYPEEPDGRIIDDLGEWRSAVDAEPHAALNYRPALCPAVSRRAQANDAGHL